MIIKDLIKLLQQEPENNELQLILDTSSRSFRIIIDDIETISSKTSVLHVQLVNQ